MLVALLALLGGCGTVAPAGSAIAMSSNRRIVAEARIATAIAFRSLASVDPLTADDVDRLRFELWETVGGQDAWLATQETSAGSGITSTVDWSHLKGNWSYKLKAYALDAAGEILNAGGAASVVTLATTLDDGTMQASVAIYLADRVFDGTVHPVITASASDARRTDHIRVTLYQRISGSWVSQSTKSTPDGSGMTKTVDFTHLTMNTSYRLKADLIKSSGSVQKSKTVSFSTGTDDDIRLTVAM